MASFDVAESGETEGNGRSLLESAYALAKEAASAVTRKSTKV